MNQRFYRLVLSGMLAAGLTLCSAAAFTQDSGGGGGMGMGGGRRAPMTPDQQLAQMTTRYNLSADQQAKIKPILEDQSQQMATIRQDTTLAQPDRMAKMQSLRSATTSKIEAVLNDQQKQQYEQDQQQMQQRMMNRGGGGGGNGGGNGGPPQ